MRKIILMAVVALILSVQNLCGAVTIEEFKSPLYEKILYPMVRMEDKSIEQKINLAILAEIDNFVADVNRSIQEYNAELLNAYVNYEIACNEAGNSKILSVVFTESKYFARANRPQACKHALNFNLKTGELIGINYLTDSDAGIIDKLSQKLREKSERENISLNHDALPLKKLPENFYWDANLHVHFIFQYYEVAAGSAGIIDVDME
ncbi:MAG: hypothetical protein IKT98_01890 [Selenomonadaceae bacterium]|nr:hypothetical protein [Selenomonadaceae bacterium]